MTNARAINRALQKQLTSLKRDGVSVTEATIWLVDGGLLDSDHQPSARLREMLREGKIKGAYQFPNKRWVIVNNSRLPDGVQRVLPMKEASRTLKMSARVLQDFVDEGKLKTLKFGDAPSLFLEDELKRFQKRYAETELGLTGVVRRKSPQLDKLKRQLYYLRSDIRLLAERIEELIKMLD